MNTKKQSATAAAPASVPSGRPEASRQAATVAHVPTREIRIVLPLRGARVCMPFNRFKVEKVIDGRIAHFGYQLPSGTIGARFSCHLTNFDLRQNMQRCLEYVAKLPEGDYSTEMEWTPSPDATISSARFIQLSRVGDAAEIMFLAFPLNILVNTGQNTDLLTVEPDLVGLLSSDLPKHRMFILDLFEGFK